MTRRPPGIAAFCGTADGAFCLYMLNLSPAYGFNIREIKKFNLYCKTSENVLNFCGLGVVSVGSKLNLFSPFKNDYFKTK